MPFSHHSHSGQFCQHATGMLEEIVQEAIKKKFIVYGLSEHSPRYRVEDLYPEEVNHEYKNESIKTFMDFSLYFSLISNHQTYLRHLKNL
jgi:histidinol-phosphatase (PHP family)